MVGACLCAPRHTPRLVSVADQHRILQSFCVLDGLVIASDGLPRHELKVTAHVFKFDLKRVDSGGLMKSEIIAKISKSALVLSFYY